MNPQEKCRATRNPANGVGENSRSDIVYDAAGRVASETVVARQAAAAGASFTTTTTYTTYGYGVVGTAGYALGAVVTIDADTWQNGSDAAVPDTRTTYGYDWFDGAVQSSIQYRPDMNNATAYNTSFGLTPTGQVGSATIADGRQRSVAFTLDAYGQTVRRDETDNNTSLGDPHQLWYRFNGRELGTVGNDTLEDGDYASSIAARQVKQGTGPFRGGQDYGGGFARFGEAYVPYTSYAQGSGGGSYTADGGETLSQLAAQLWGDASLWYLLAEANGISSDISLIQGQAVTLPQGVTRNSNTAATFKPYDPAEALGNLNPTTPKPQKKAKNCGTFGAILVAVVSLAVTLVLPATGMLARIGVGLLANAAGQGVAIATGLQSKFDFKGFAMAGITAGVTAGLDKTGAFDSLGIAVSSGAARAAQAVLGASVSQGIGVATGLRPRFDFAGVAAAGVGAYAGARFGGAGLGGRIQGIGADALASASTRSVLTGADFGDNLIAVLPDVIARTLGAVAEDVIARGQARSLAHEGDRAGDANGAGWTGAGNRSYLGRGAPVSSLAVADEAAEEIVVVGRRLPASEGYRPYLRLQTGPGVPTADTTSPGEIAPRAPPLNISVPVRTILRGALKRVPLVGIAIELFDANQIGDMLSIPIEGTRFTIGGQSDDRSRVLLGEFGNVIGGLEESHFTNAYRITEVDGRYGQFNADLPIVGGANVILITAADGQQRGFGVRIHTEADWGIIGEGLANGWDYAQIQDAINSGYPKTAAETATARAASTDLVPVATKALGEWGETRLSSFLGGQGVKPTNPFKTPLGPRYPDRLLDGISYESKAGLNVKLTSSIERQIAKDAYLINKGFIDGAEWHFWRGARPELIQALQKAGIKSVVH